MIDPNDLSSDPKRILLPSALMHDLRTPINHIVGYSEMLIDQMAEGVQEDPSADLHRVSAAAKNLLALIDRSFVSSSGEAAALPILDKSNSASTPPLQLANSISVSTPSETPSGERTAQGLFLVVDDNEGNRDLLSRLLQRQGYDVDTTENGRLALEKMQDGSYDLVLLDIMMPEMDGFEVLHRIKADDRLKRVPVIMISALGEMDSVARCIEMGAEDFLPKPFNPTILNSRIGACLEKKRVRDHEMRLFDELEHNYKRLKELERLRDDLTQMIVHDLRTPLTSLITGMQTLEVVGDLNVDQKEMRDIALVGGQTLLGMINDLLDVEKLESGAMQLNYDVLSVRDLVTESVGQVSSLLENKQLKIVEQVEAELPSLLGDAGKLRRTLVNLLGNAIKFTPAAGTVTVGARVGGDRQSVEFFVSDTGEGIPPESFERIFEKFGQVESRQSGRTMSTGLGLTFCRLAVEAHGGHIEVESAPGQGSNFSFTIPLPSASG